MSEYKLSIRNLVKHIDNPAPITFSLRQLLDHQSANLKLHALTSKFSIMTQNMGLLAFPGKYLGSDREGALSEIISVIKARSPDIVGLCEVFVNQERETVRDRVKDIYSYFSEGPDEADLESDGGLLLLSKHPILEKHQIIYRDSAGDDRFANKGVLHIRVHPTNSPMPYDIFYTHTQNIDEDGGKEALYAQLTAMSKMIQERRDQNIPTLIFGDLNIPGEIPEYYHQLISRLEHPIDLWEVSGKPRSDSFTFIADNNFYSDEDDNPHQNHRLDYVLMKPGVSFVPILGEIEILQITHNSRLISDHLGLGVQFNTLLQISF